MLPSMRPRADEGRAFDVAFGPFVGFANVEDDDFFAGFEPVAGFLQGHVGDGLLGGLHHLLSYVFHVQSPYSGVVRVSPTRDSIKGGR